VKVTKQRAGLVLVLGAGACALFVDRVVLRNEGGLQKAAAAVLPAGTLSDLEKVKSEAIDRTQAAIADRLERVARKQTSGRNAFDIPWAVRPVVLQESQRSPDIAAHAAQPEVKVAAPWKLTRVSEVGGMLAVVLDRVTVLRLGGVAVNGLELVSATGKGGKPHAIVREVATGTEYRLELQAGEGTSEKR
jgi:hypothetical protein